MTAILVVAAGVGIGVQAPPPHRAAADPAPVTIDSLARDVSRLESLREVKDVQRSYTQLSQFGRWGDMAALFAADGTLQWGTQTATGRGAIESWFATTAGAMDGVSPGSLHTEIIDEPLVNLSVDGLSAKSRWMGMRFLGDGHGTARIEGGVYENEYVLRDGRWQISLLHYYPQYEGDYATGWRNVGGQRLPIVPFHFTSDETGIPIPPAEGAAPPTTATAAELTTRIAKLNNEDEVRNLQDAYGYYVDRKMWTDVVDLFAAGATVTIDGVGTYTGSAGARQAMERMGAEGLTHGQLNDRPIFDLIVDVNPDGREATTRGVEVGMLGNADTHEGGWEFSAFRNHFVKEDGLWKLKDLAITPLLSSPYAGGWGNGGTAPHASVAPAFLDVAGRSARPATGQAANPSLTDLKRRLDRSQAYDGTENVSAAYGYYIDDSQWQGMAAIFATEGSKAFAFAGYYFGRDRIQAAGTASYGAPLPLTALRTSISYHWRTQSVILVSQDGRSATLRTRLFQPRTSTNVVNGSTGYWAGMYPNDSAVLEDGIWRIWMLEIDESYFSTPNWAGGWAAAVDPTSTTNPPGSPLLTRYPPDIKLTEMPVRQEGFTGGTGRTIVWPGILPMWFHYRNLVTGRVPQKYWPDCPPCDVRPDASMLAHGYQLPPSGPTSVTATSAPVSWGTAATVTVSIAAGPDEPLAGSVELWEGSTPRGSGAISTPIALPPGLSGGTHTLTVLYQGSDRLAPGQTTVSVTVNLPPAWNSSTVYNSPDRVTYNGKVYVANWYNRNQKPGDPYGAWQELAMTDAGVTIWTPSRIFDTGDRVTYNGHLYEAKWWTRNQAPGDRNGPWRPVG
ncbi:nuclear transport factor 2 family protein [Dactylosporangium sp. CA-092794]|uniref:nuclear transport factor 2 family protein n=1 Tax=Dactylosporangium sp. CA-092794 TaxID=3239929 RepID=UPI003D8CEC04